MADKQDVKKTLNLLQTSFSMCAAKDASICMMAPLSKRI